MKGNQTLVLNHLYECGLLEPDEIDEVLPMFNPDVASIIAISTVSAFSSDGSDPKLDTIEKLEWSIQSVAYCFNLPTLYDEAVKSALNVFCYWITSEDTFLNRQQRNKYTRKMLRFSSKIADFNSDKAHPSLRQNLMDQYFQRIEKFIDACAYFDPETWDLLIRILLGIADYYTTQQAINVLTDAVRKPLLQKDFELAFTAISKCKNISDSLWNIILKYFNVFSSQDVFLSCWSVALLKQYEELLDFLFDDKLVPRTDISEEEYKLAGTRLARLLHHIKQETVFSDPKLSLIMSSTVEGVYRISNKKTRKRNELFIEGFPVDPFMELFARWILQPFGKLEPQYLKIPSKVLMKIISNWSCDGSKWLPYILSACAEALQMNMPLTTLRHGHHLLTKFYGPELIDLFDKAIDRLQFVGITLDTFWAGYSTVLEDLAEIGQVKSSAYEQFTTYSKHLHSLTRILSVASRHDPKTFEIIATKILRNASNSPSLLQMELAANIFVVIAANLPFAQPENLSNILFIGLNCASTHRSILPSFLVLVKQAAYWASGSLSKLFIREFMQLAQDSSSECHSMKAIVSSLFGRPISTERSHADASTTFMIGKSIVTLVGDLKRNESFTVQVREQRGLLEFDIRDDPGLNNLTFGELPDHFNPPPDSINSDYMACNMIEKLKTESIVKKEYEEPIDFKSMPHINILSQQKLPCSDAFRRHKLADFLLQNRLDNRISRLVDPEAAIKGFDAIPLTSSIAVRVMMIKCDNDQKSKYENLLGYPRPVELGSVCISFVDDKADIDLVLSGDRRKINKEFNEFKSKLTIFVRSTDGTLLSISTRAPSAFPWRMPKERLVRPENLARIVAELSFAFSVLNKPDLLYSKDLERQTFLSNLKRESVSALDIINAFDRGSAPVQL